MTSLIFRVDSLLAGTLFLPWEVHCAGVMSSAAGPVEIIPAHGENDSGLRRKPFAFPSESLFAFSPESCSPSPRNAFRDHPGIAFAFARMPQLDTRAFDRAGVHPFQPER